MKPNVGFEPTTFRFQVDKFAVSILKLAPPDGFEPPNVGIKIRGLTTWRKGYKLWYPVQVTILCLTLIRGVLYHLTNRAYLVVRVTLEVTHSSV